MKKVVVFFAISSKKVPKKKLICLDVKKALQELADRLKTELRGTLTNLRIGQYMKAILVLSMTLAAAQAFALPKYAKAFKAAYPQGTKAECILCHAAEGNAFNSYGVALQKTAQGGKLDFKAVEALDSDEDTYTNLEEITAGSKPGDKDSTPSRP
jgi:GGDEF domain-containing protein